MNWDTEDGRGFRSFPSTSWSILNRLKNPGLAPDSPALQGLINLYWKPVYCLIRHSWRKSVDDSKDMTQEFFLRMVLQGELVQKFAPERGSFRGFIKAAVLNFMRDQNKTAERAKRGGNAKFVPLQIHDFDLTEVIADADGLTPDQVFDAAWKNVVINRAVSVLKERLTSQGKDVYFEVFRRYQLDGKDPDISYKSLGTAIGLDEQTVKKHLEYARNEFRLALLAVVSDYVDNESDFTAEMKELFGG